VAVFWIILGFDMVMLIWVAVEACDHPNAWPRCKRKTPRRTSRRRGWLPRRRDFFPERLCQ
jgi:hypothetical protein